MWNKNEKRNGKIYHLENWKVIRGALAKCHFNLFLIYIDLHTKFIQEILLDIYDNDDDDDDDTDVMWELLSLKMNSNTELKWKLIRKWW